MKVSDKITVIKGVGDKTAPLYNKIGIEDVDDLIHYFPRDYCMYDEVTENERLEADKILAFKAYVMTYPVTKRVRRLQITSTTLKAGNNPITATWFHMPYLSKSLSVGKEYVFRGKLTVKGDHFHIEQAQIFTIEQYNLLSNKISPLYSLTKGLSNSAITKTMRLAFDGLELSDFDNSLKEMHFPTNYEELGKVRANLVYEEFLLFILRLRLLKENNDRAQNHFNMIEVSECSRAIERLPYKLTNAQINVWNEIKNDMISGHSMSRLVQGDVGSGKTILSFLAAIMAAANGYQSCIMAPTEILAAQHYEALKKLLEENKLEYEPVLLTGSMTEATKRGIREKIETGVSKIVVGTHALIQDKVEYNNLALVVTDEQHRFGVHQREALSKKNMNDSVHVLVMSATPIPRTLALIIYGDLAISVIDEVPSHKLPIKNAIVDEKYRLKAYEHIKKEIDKGRQAYIICPLVEESEGLDAKNVVDYTDELTQYFPESINIGMLHGKMKPKDKQKVMNDFANGNIHILVSTTVVEVGVNVPNATVMLIENADRFGLAQLHQLRGRVGRGKEQSYCIFMSGNNSKNTMERLEILGKSNDGFEIAREDLKQRGPGDMFGIRQSGQMEFRLADIFSDANILKKAADAAEVILNDDPNLEKDENRQLRRKLDDFIAKKDIGKTI